MGFGELLLGPVGAQDWGGGSSLSTRDSSRDGEMLEMLTKSWTLK